MSLFSLQLLPETFMIQRRIQQNSMINVHRSSSQKYIPPQPKKVATHNSGTPETWRI